jgi:hypothetical protein
MQEIQLYQPDVIISNLHLDEQLEDAPHRQFVTANTNPIAIEEMRNNHIIPVYAKDNEPLISHNDFIDVVESVVWEAYKGEYILKPIIRVSHPIKGRVPEARNKPANELNDWEKTLYYERMAFIIEIPSITTDIDGNNLSLTIGGVKSYSQDNLYSKKGSDEHFNVFIGFKNQVCTNLCVWTDGFMDSIKVDSIGMLRACVQLLISKYNINYQISQMQLLPDYSLTEHQFATLIGKCRMYGHLPQQLKNQIPQLQMGDTQIAAVCKDYYKDNSFCRDSNGNINLWKLYNLFTGANKSSYIDNFLDRGVNAYHFVERIRFGLENKQANWFLD